MVMWNYCLIILNSTSLGNKAIIYYICYDTKDEISFFFPNVWFRVNMAIWHGIIIFFNLKEDLISLWKCIISAAMQL